MNGRTNDYEFKIRTMADLTALQNLRRELEAQRKAVEDTSSAARVLDNELRKVNSALETQAAKAAASAQALTKTAHRMTAAGVDASAVVAERDQALDAAGLPRQGRFGQAAGAFGSAFLDSGGGLRGLMAGGRAGIGMLGGGAALAGGGLAAVGVVAKAAADGLREYAAAENEVAKLDAALAQRGQLTNAYRESLQAMAQQMQKTTAIASSDWVGVLTKLTQFGADKSNITASADAVKHLAGVLGGDLQTAATMVGKALQGEFTAFSRMGIEFDKNASQVENLNHLYRELALRGGGQLEASAQTINGKFRQLRNTLSDVSQGFGQMVADTGIVQFWVDLTAKGLDHLAGNLTKTIPKAGDLRNAMKDSATETRAAEEATKRYAKEMEELKQRLEETARAQERVTSGISDQTRARIEQKEAESAEQIASIDAAVKSGAISEEEGRRRKAAVRGDTERFKQDAEQSDRIRRADVLRAEEGSNSARVAQARKREEELKTELAKAQERQTAKENEGRKFDNDIRALERYVEMRSKEAPHNPAFDSKDRRGWHPVARKNVEDAEAEIARLQAAKTSRMEEIGAGPTVAAIDAEIKRAIGEREAAQKFADDRAKVIRPEREKVESEITRAENINAIRNRTRFFDEVGQRDDHSATMTQFIKAMQGKANTAEALMPLIRQALTALVAQQQKDERTKREIDELREFAKNLDRRTRNR